MTPAISLLNSVLLLGGSFMSPDFMQDLQTPEPLSPPPITTEFQEIQEIQEPPPAPPVVEPTPKAESAPPPAPALNLPPRSVLMCESGGDYRAENPRSSASGGWQMIRATSDWVAGAIGRPDLVGVPASQWRPRTQDRGAAWLWDGGRGASHWRACLP